MIKLYDENEFEKASIRENFLLKCKVCGISFYKTKRDICSCFTHKERKSGDYCSNKCQRHFECPPIKVFCKNCNKEFKKSPACIKKSPNHFCCHSCAAKYNNTHKTKGTRVSKLEIWLQKQLTLLYPQLEIHYNRKDAINSELDIYIPSLKLAFELNGIFHYEPIYGKEKLEQTKNNDNRKFQACIENEIELCLIDVSAFGYFKEIGAKKYLEIISKVIDKKQTP